MSSNLDAYLLGKGIKKEVLEKAKRWAESNSCTLSYAFEKLSVVQGKDLLRLFANFYGVKRASLEKMKISQSIISLVKPSVAKKNMLIPIDKHDGELVIATADPSDVDVFETLRFQTGLICKPVFATEGDIREAHIRYYSRGVIEVSDQGLGKVISSDAKAREKRIMVTDESSGEGPIVKLVNDIILSCISHKSSDIHVEAYEQSLRVRLRTDGMLHEVVKPPLHFKDALISRIKIMADLDIAETRLPQDGSLKIQTEDREVAFRVSSIPCVGGEKIVLRILDNSQLANDISELGFEPKQLKMFEDALSVTNGVVLVTGPTGSGKTTTLYSALDKLNSTEVNIVTAEDPVEYVVSNINQVQVKPSIDFTFASALRAFLRQDPDIIMVGEIRDLETADIAIKAALTGHLVLSTLHTNSAPDTISRLLNMGVAPFNLIASIRCVMAQRLMRRVCHHCKVVDRSITPENFLDIGIPKRYINKIKPYIGKGCNKCNQSGVLGRVAIYEVLVINDAIKRLIFNRASSLEIKETAMRNGMKTLRQSAITKMAQGLCSVAEVVRVTDADMSPAEMQKKREKLAQTMKSA